MIGILSAWLCAMSMRSNGSWCGPGRSPARTPCSIETGNSSNRSRAIYSVKFAARSSAPGSLPRRTLVAISQADAALARIVFSGLAITLRTAAEKDGSSMNHQSNAWVSKRKRTAHSQALSSSSGSGSKNSLPTWNFPFRLPGFRRLFASVRATRRATGSSPREIMISSPSQASWMSLERFVLAS